MPHLTGPEKIAVIQNYALKATCWVDGVGSFFSVFIETGTAHGETTQAMVDYNERTADTWAQKQFERIVTIDLAKDNYDTAIVRFAGVVEVLPVLGDSGIMLPYLLDAIDRPAIFWLDAHYDHDDRPRGVAGDTPIVDELAHIFHRKHGNLILIDDARLFGGGDEADPAYPSLDRIAALAEQNNYRYTLADDIIRLEHRDGPDFIPDA